MPSTRQPCPLSSLTSWILKSPHLAPAMLTRYPPPQGLLSQEPQTWYETNSAQARSLELAEVRTSKLDPISQVHN